jgi:hypothetical protein
LSYKCEFIYKPLKEEIKKESKARARAKDIETIQYKEDNLVASIKK